MGCYNCKCEFCARSSELCSIYQTPGEIDDIDKVCYTCEDCKYWDGDLRLLNGASISGLYPNKVLNI